MVLLLTFCAVVLVPGAAKATNLFSLDSQASSGGPIVVDADGTGYVAWDRKTSGSETVFFCRIPRGGACTSPIQLALPSGAPPASEAPVEPYTVFGQHSGDVYVIGPRYTADDTLIWSSTNDGESFSVPEVIPKGSYAGDTGVADVVRDPAVTASDVFFVASADPGIGFSETGEEFEGKESTPSSFSFADTPFYAAAPTLGLTVGGVPVEAYYNEGSEPYEVSFFRYKLDKYGLGNPVDSESSWTGPTEVTDGYLPRLAGGPAGLFLLTVDDAPGAAPGAQPTLVDVRKYEESTHTFGAPTLLAVAEPSVANLFVGGNIAENQETGAIDVVFPLGNGAGESTMRLWESSNGGASFSGERQVATIAGGTSGVPRIAFAADGEGYVTFRDEGGLELASLAALPGKPPSGGSSSGGSLSGGSSPASTPTSKSSGQSTGSDLVVAAKKVGAEELQLVQPSAQCTASSSKLTLRAQSVQLGGKGLPRYRAKLVRWYINGGTKKTKHHKVVFEPQRTTKSLPSAFTFLPEALGAHTGKNRVLVKIALTAHVRVGKHHNTLHANESLKASFDVC